MAINHEQSEYIGILVWDQCCSGKGKAIGPRVLTWGAAGHADDGNGFYVID